MIKTNDSIDDHTFIIHFSPFRINYKINDEWVMEVNTNDLLYFESPNNVSNIDVR